MPALVSILIPAFNAEQWIAETLESALRQSWLSKEIIVVDDGSTDGTLAIARGFVDRGVAVLSQPRQGACAARNRAFSLSKGAYVQWLDADDILADNKIERQLEGLGNRPPPRLLLSCPWGLFLHRTSKAWFDRSPLWCNLSPVEWLMRKMEHGCHMQPATWLVSRELTEAAGTWDVRLHKDQDGEYFNRVICASEGIRFVPDTATYYRHTGSGSVSHIGRSKAKLESQFLSMSLQIAGLLALDNSSRARRAALKYLQDKLILFYPETPDLVQEMEVLAKSLGGALERPRLSWKYAWLQKMFGWGVAKGAQAWYNAGKFKVRQSWDRAIARRERKQEAGRDGIAPSAPEWGRTDR